MCASVINVLPPVRDGSRREWKVNELWSSTARARRPAIGTDRVVWSGRRGGVAFWMGFPGCISKSCVALFLAVVVCILGTLPTLPAGL